MLSEITFYNFCIFHIIMGTFTVYAIKSAICLALLYLPYTLLMRRDTFHAFNRTLLLSIVVISLVLPLMNIPVISNTLPIEEVSITNELDEAFGFVEEDVPLMEDNYATTPTATTETIEKPVIAWAFILTLIYIIGVVVCLGWKTLQLIRLYRYIPSNCLWKDTIDGIQVYGHFDEVCPFSWMNSIVITDEDFRSNPSVMQHERAHIRLHHSWDNLFVSFVEVLQWFNPCIWMLDYSLREVHEYEADAEVLTQGVTLQNYQSLLIRKAIGTSSYDFTNGFNHSLLKKRIKMMMKKKTNRWSYTKALYLLPVTAVALAAFATPEFAEKADAVIESEPSTTDLPPIEGEILQICENMPHFPGGEQAMLKFIAENAHYPENAQKAGIEGLAVVEFIVDKKGKIHEPRVIKGLTRAFDEEVLRVVRAMPDWEPGTLRGEKKNVRYTLPVSFKIDQATKNQLSIGN